MRVSRTLPNVPFVVASSCGSDSCAHASSKRRFAHRLYVKKSGSPLVITLISFYDVSSYLLNSFVFSSIARMRTGSETSCNGRFMISSRKSFPDRVDTNRTRQKRAPQKAWPRERDRRHRWSYQ